MCVEAMVSGEDPNALEKRTRRRLPPRETWITWRSVLSVKPGAGGAFLASPSCGEDAQVPTQCWSAGNRRGSDKANEGDARQTNVKASARMTSLFKIILLRVSCLLATDGIEPGKALGIASVALKVLFTKHLLQEGAVPIG